MAKIPTGNFGNVSFRAPQLARSSNVGDDSAALGGALQHIQQNFSNAELGDAYLDSEIAHKEVAQGVKQDVATGKIKSEEATAALQDRLSKVKAPKLRWATPAQTAALSTGVARLSKSTTMDMQAYQLGATAMDGHTLAVSSIDKLKVLGDMPDADVPKLLTRGQTTATNARAAGVPEAQVSAMLSDLHTGLASSLAQRDPQGTLNALSKPDGNALLDGLDLETRRKLQTIAEQSLVKRHANAIAQTYSTQGTEAGTHALSVLSQSGLSPELQDDVRASVNGQVARLRDQRRQEHVDSIAGIETNIATDTASRGTLAKVQSLYHVGALTPAEFANYNARIESSIIERNRNEAASQGVADALNSGLPLDPNNSEHRKVLSGAFAHETTGMPVGSQPWQSTAIGLADHARMLPDQARNWTRQALRSPDPLLSASAAQFYGAVSAAVPDALTGFDEETKAFAATVNGMIEAGAEPAKAVETARANVFDLKPDLVKHRQAQYTQGGVTSFAGTSDTALKSLIDKDFGSFWHGTPVPTANLGVDFNSQTQRYFQKTGDINLARSLAWQDLKRVYGVTEVNGTKQLSAFPVERFGVKPEEVRSDIADYLASNPQADGSTAEEVLLVPDALTLRSVANTLTGENVRPSYRLITKSGDLVVDSHGVPKRYTLPTGEELAAHFKAMDDEAKQKAQAIVDQARAQRESERQRKADLRAAQQYGYPVAE